MRSSASQTGSSTANEAIAAILFMIVSTASRQRLFRDQQLGGLRQPVMIEHGLDVTNEIAVQQRAQSP
jgi:hypothetical protein